MAQTIISGDNSHRGIGSVLAEMHAKKFLLVCDGAFPHLNIAGHFDSLRMPSAVFDRFTSNPLYEDVREGVRLFHREQCDSIVAVGGGSSLDVAKCIKLFCKMDPERNYLSQGFEDSGVPLAALPTTAGTGSESTQYAVIYFEGEKQSIHHESILPDYAILDPSVLMTLPPYQKKCTMLDALCQGIESWWSVNSTEKSRKLSRDAVAAINQNWRGYIFANTDEAAERIMQASNWAGQAINIAQTTAAHAMSYKLTSMYELPHGHAVAVCLPKVWEYMDRHIDECADLRGSRYVAKVLSEINAVLGTNSVDESIAWFDALMSELDMRKPKAKGADDLLTLSASVNPVRLKNNPVFLSESALRELYAKIIMC